MNEPAVSSKSTIFFSCLEENYYSKESIIENTLMMHITAGQMTVVEGDKTLIFKDGDTVLFPRNQLVKVTKHPMNGVPYKSFSIYFSQEILQKYYADHFTEEISVGIPKIKLLNKNQLLDSLTNSLAPYFELTETLPEHIVNGKIQEALNILRVIDKEADSVLYHFAQPGKIDLGSFMQKNYAFNIPIERFAYLTGRSLATFKRDFQKEFNTPPQKWLLLKRLEQAHYLIAEKKQKPSNVYLSVGFENLSHFSFTFKKLFGYNPTHLL